MIGNLCINEKRKQLYYEKGWWSVQTLADVWHASVRAHASNPYVKDGSRALSYIQVEQSAARLANHLAEQGVKPGDVITFQIPKWVEFAIIYVACLKLGAVMHPLDVRFGIDNIVSALNTTQTQVYICPTYYHRRNYELEFHSIAHLVPSVKHTVFVDRERPAHASEYAFTRIMSTYPTTQLAITHDTPGATSDDVACILSTSGSTGTPKHALLTHNNILFSERAYLSVLDITEQDAMWMPSPLNHATGFFHGLIAAMLAGSRVVLQQCYQPKRAAELIKREGCTWSHGATPFIYDLLKHLDETNDTLPTLRLFFCGGAPVPRDLVEHAARYGITLCESYGSTESIPHLFVPPEKCHEWNGRYSGIAYEGIEVRVVDDQRHVVAPGVQGEECSRGPQVFVGYLNEPERTARALDDEGWFYSGDLCTMDTEGRVRINGRKKEIIIRGGENISSSEVDAHLTGITGVGDHATVGMPDERMGERICTFVVAQEGHTPTLESITGELARAGVPKRIWPERIELIEEIPYTATGKIQRYKLLEELLKRMGKA